MAEEQQQENQEQKAENPGMEKALNGGWRPESEWEGNAEDWVDYREFNIRGELMGRIQEQSGMLNNQKKQMGELKVALKDMANLQDTIAEREYNRLMKQLKTAKVEAIENSDGEAVTEIDEQMATLKEKREDARPVEDDPQQEQEANSDVPPEIQEWIANPRNSWYSTDEFMQTVAHGIAQNLSAKNPNWTPLQVVTAMEKEVRNELPHKFSSKGSPVGEGDGGNRPSGGGRKQGRKFADLNEEEKAVARRLDATGTLSIDEYIKQLDGE